MSKDATGTDRTEKDVMDTKTDKEKSSRKLKDWRSLQSSESQGNLKQARYS